MLSCVVTAGAVFGCFRLCYLVECGRRVVFDQIRFEMFARGILGQLLDSPASLFEF